MPADGGTNLLTCYFLGDRSLSSFEAFVFPDLTGVVVHDRQVADAFRALIHAANLAREQGLAVAPDEADAEHLKLFRPAKTQQKIFVRVRSEQAARHRYAIRGYISTAAKHRASVLSALRDALLGQPWLPSMPEPP